MNGHEKTIEVEFLRSLFMVTDDGGLIRKVDAIRIGKAGDVAGAQMPCGYRVVRVRGKRIYTHRIIFALVHGRWPDGEIDHINGNKSDSRPCNLREATRSQNRRNIPAMSNNALGIKGVGFLPDRGKFQAQIRINGKGIFLGRFLSAEEASAAYKEAAIRIHGEFAYRGEMQ